MMKRKSILPLITTAAVVGVTSAIAAAANGKSILSVSSGMLSAPGAWKLYFNFGLSSALVLLSVGTIFSWLFWSPTRTRLVALVWLVCCLLASVLLQFMSSSFDLVAFVLLICWVAWLFVLYATAVPNKGVQLTGLAGS